MIAILGDSFCRPCHDIHFSRLLEESTNYSWAGASNHNICQQAEKCIEEDKADRVFVSFTSSVRIGWKLRPTSKDGLLLFDRYLRPHDKQDHADLINTTWFRMTRDHDIDPHKVERFKSYHKEFTDLDHQVDMNYHLIKGCLDNLQASGKKIMWSQGGFEHPSFGKTRQWDFHRFSASQTDLNLWDLTDTPDSLQHIEDPDTHRMIAQRITDHFKRY